MRGDRDLDVICAPATPPGIGGISVIRVSGPRAIEISRKVCPFIPLVAESHKAYFGFAQSISTSEEIDQVLALVFLDSRSFTGEPTVEISCHGSPQIVQELLNALVDGGCRIAGRGEFTYRAFINGKLDLVQAESVLALVNSQSKLAAKASLRQLKGGLSKDLEMIEDTLIWLLAHLEADIDFSTEGLEVVDYSEALLKLKNIEVEIKRLLDSYRVGRCLQHGFRVALVGRPNSGKSSLLNCVLKEERAIVSDIAGTTRDVIEDQILIGGALVKFSDTAGLRESADEIEKIGVARARGAAEDADLLLAVIDISDAESYSVVGELEALLGKTRLVVNKMDKALYSEDVARTTILDWAMKNFPSKAQGLVKLLNGAIFVSAHSESGGEKVISLIQRELKTDEYEDLPVLSQTRHYECLVKAFDCMERARVLIDARSSQELPALELREALLAVQEILGKHFDDQIMDRVFKEFCIGK